MDDSGWSIIAHANAELGIGESARRLIRLLQQSGVPLEVVPLQASKSRKNAQFDFELGDRPNYSNVISCVNPDQLGYVVTKFGLNPKTLSRHVGFWAWELERVPRVFREASYLVDEIWTLSRFCQTAIQANSRVAVRVPSLPLGRNQNLDLPFDLGSTPKYSDQFKFLLNFDYQSDVRRKNPAAAIRAFSKSFAEGSGAILVVKSINAHLHPEAAKALRTLAESRPDIVFIDQYLSETEKFSLLNSCDVFVSPHRSEGYGLNIADAMDAGKPVICTGYSGNLDFCDSESSFLLPYKLVPVNAYAGWKTEALWADPDEDALATAMKRLFEDQKLCKALGLLGQANIRSQLALEHAVAKFRDEFMEEDGNR